MPPIWATTCFACVAVGAAPKGLICSRPPVASCAVSGDESHPAAWGRCPAYQRRLRAHPQPASSRPPGAVGLLRCRACLLQAGW